MRRHVASLLLLSVWLVGCSTGTSVVSTSTPAAHSAPGASAPTPQAANAWPTALPRDGVQPWETTDASGNVVPAARSSSSVNAQSIFASGEQSFASGGMVTTVGDAAHLDSGTAGSHTLSYATYRLTLGGVQPGVVGLDVNLDTASSAYWVGLSDYSAGHWVWRGPFTDNHIRLVKAPGQLDSANYLSTSGNLFVAVAAYDGSSVDVVGVGANPVTDGDAALPPAPAAFAATPEPGGLLLEWTPSAAGDLAGYRILWSNSSFTGATDFGVQSRDYSDGGGRLFLPLPQHLTFVALQAVDIAGNASALTNVLNAVPLTGTPPSLGVTVSAPSGLHDTPITLTATGAASYDFDLDGDGVYDVTGNTTGTASVDTSKPGIIRPGVRGHGADGQAVALGGVSLIITGNTPPSVSAVASPQTGTAPLDATFTATAQDAEDDASALTYAWDFNGDGIYEPSTNLASLQHTYTTAGTYNAKVRVTDTQGAWDVDTLAITVAAAPPPPNQPPTASFTVAANQQILPMRLSYNFDGSASSDPEDGTPVQYDWDFNGDGVWDAFDGPAALAHTYPSVGTYSATLRVRDSAGVRNSLSQPVYVPSTWSSFGGQPGAYTRRSPVVGAQTNHIKWSYATTSFIEGPAAVGPDGTVYIGSDDHKLYALKDNGTATPTVKWKLSTGDTVTASPAIGADGTVYIGGNDKKVYALQDNGASVPSVKWSFTTGGKVVDVTVGPDGTVYVGGVDTTFYALVDNGTNVPTVKWQFTADEFLGNAAIGPDGTVYVGCADKNVYALKDNGTATPTVKWSYTTGGVVASAPALGPDGTVYVASEDNTLYALSDNGTAIPTVKWSFTTGDRVDTSPALGPDGTVYILGNDSHLYALTDNGTASPTVKWDYPTGGHSSPAVDAEGRVYFSAGGGIHAAVDNGTSTPTVLWTYTAAGGNGSVAIGPDGTIYVGSADHKVYAIGP